MTPTDKLQLVKMRIRENEDLRTVMRLLVWDQATYMPPAATASRGRVQAQVGRLIHNQITDPELGRLIDELSEVDLGEPTSPDAALVRVARKERERAVRLPAEYVERTEKHFSRMYRAWTEARTADDFELIRPLLEKTVDLSREYADYFPEYDSPIDPHIDRQDEGFTSDYLKTFFADLSASLVPLANTICDQEPPDDSCLRQPFPVEAQRRFGEQVIRALGFSFERGRQDLTEHPFMIRFHYDDIRITTRFDPDNLSQGLFGSIHESGHAMYEQGIDPELDGYFTGNGTSHAVHESQSRLWENIVGRSRGFWEHYYDQAREHFPEQLEGVSLDTFYRAINRVERSLVRTEADEVTYNLHVIIRFELEAALLEEQLSVRDLPERWNELYEEKLGKRPASDRQGVLQDVHWYHGHVGGQFQSYALGNVMSAQLYAAALKAHPEIPAEIAEGHFATLHSWLRKHIYRAGRTIESLDLVERATGKPFGQEDYMALLREKYGQLYHL